MLAFQSKRSENRKRPFQSMGRLGNPGKIDAARQALENHPCFRGRSRFVEAEQHGDMIVLTGNFPSFYLKQLAQETVKSVVGECRVQNRIVVASPVGEVESEKGRQPSSIE